MHNKNLAHREGQPDKLKILLCFPIFVYRKGREDRKENAKGFMVEE